MHGQKNIKLIKRSFITADTVFMARLLIDIVVKLT